MSNEKSYFIWLFVLISEFKSHLTTAHHHFQLSPLPPFIHIAPPADVRRYSYGAKYPSNHVNDNGEAITLAELQKLAQGEWVHRLHEIGWWKDALYVVDSAL